MSDEQQATSALERQRYHSRLPLIETTTMANTIGETIRLASVNYGAVAGARPGFVLDGLGTVGKSTIVMEMGRRYEKAVRKKFGLSATDNAGLNTFLPVAYVTLPATITVKGFNQLLLNFYGIPSRGSSESEMTNSIIETCSGCNTSLMLIDDIHFLQMKNRSHQVVNNHLKTLASQISATFGYAGIGVEHSNLLSEGNSPERREFSQTDHRFARYEIGPFKRDGKDYPLLLKAFELSLCLVKLKPGELENMRNYIHDRTAGFIGPISLLLRLGANLAIKNGTEALSQSLLNKIKLDHASQSHYKTVSRRSA